LRLPFRTSLLLAPLAYAIHHGEEHLIFNFRAWRLRYFADNNALSTEAVLVILVSVSMVYLLLHATIRNRVSAWTALAEGWVSGRTLWIRFVTGAMELAGAVGLLIPATHLWATAKPRGC
jgi:hypothetical protein